MCERRMNEMPSLICVHRLSGVLGRNLCAANWPMLFVTLGKDELDVRGRTSWLTENRRSLTSAGLTVCVHFATPVCVRSFSVPLLLSALVVSVSAAPPTVAAFSAAASLKL